MTYRVKLAVLAAATVFIGASAVAQDGPDVASRSVMGVEVGATLGDMRNRVKGVEWEFIGNYMVDLSADCASLGDEWLFCALTWAESAYDPQLQIEGFVVLSDQLAARDGVRVGMPLDEAAALWGAPTLSFHYANEGREFIQFPNAPEGVSARGSYGGDLEETFGGHYGVYPSDDGSQEYHETQKYDPKTVIGSLWVF